ncbi:hypothetical protein D3C78_605950 [compost metagenome]
MSQATANSIGASGTSSAAAAPPIAIAPVEPVEVKIGTNPENGSASADEPKAVNGNVTEDNTSSNETETIVKLLEQKWDLDPKVIQVDGGVVNNVKL